MYAAGDPRLSILSLSVLSASNRDLSVNYSLALPHKPVSYADDYGQPLQLDDATLN
jgi:hypothetical protein